MFDSFIYSRKVKIYNFYKENDALAGEIGC